MVQIIQGANPWASLLGGLGTGVAAGIAQGLQNKQQLRLAETKEAAKAQKNQELLKQFGFRTPGEELAGSAEKFQKLGPDQKAMLTLTNPAAFKAYEQLETGIKEEEEKVQKKENLSGILNSMSETLLEGNLGYTPAKYATAKGRRDAQYFDSLGVQLESIGKEMVSKGVLSAPRFAYLLSNLPSAHKSDASNAGAIEAWSDELGLERPKGLESLYAEKRKSKKKSGTKSKMVVFKDEEGNIYDIPEHLAEHAKSQGLRAE